MLFATSCAKDIDGVGVPSGDKATVTFNVDIENVISTRSISDGETVDILYYAVFNNDGEPVGDQEETTISGKEAEVEIALVKGDTYKVAFWAQKGTAYTVDLPNVTVDYNVSNNNEDRDAFCAVATIVAGQNDVESVTLKRPFAQINFGVTAAEGETIPEVKESSMTVKSGAYSKLNLLTNDISGEVKNAVFSAAAVPTEELSANNQKYTYLSMSYVLVSGANVELSFTFDDESYSIDAVPAVANQRTNLLASIDTEKTKFEVKVEPAYDKDNDVDEIPFVDDDEPQPEEKKVTVSEIKAELAGEYVTFEASYEYEGDGTLAATFVCTPEGVQTRAAEPIKVKATSTENNKFTAQKEASEFEKDVKYTVTLEVTIDDEPADVDASGSTGTSTPDFTVPDEQTPGGDDEEVYAQVTKFADITAGDYVFVAKNGNNYYTFSNATAAAGKLTAVQTPFTVGTTLTGDVEGYNWSFDGTKLYSKAVETNYLYSTATNNGMTVGTTTTATAGAWTFAEDTKNAGCFTMTVTDVSDNTRTFAMYNTQDWRSYTSAAATGQTRNIMVFKKMKASEAPETPGTSDTPNTDPEPEPEPEPEQPGGDIETPSTPALLDQIKAEVTNFPNNAYGSQNVNDEGTWVTWTIDDVTFTGVKICEAPNTGNYGGTVQMQGNASDATKQGFFGNKTGKKIAKIVVETLNDQYSPTFNVYFSSTASMPSSSNAEHTINAATCSDSGVASGSTTLYTTTIDVTGDYTYFALRNDNVGAVYVKSITVTYAE